MNELVIVTDMMGWERFSPTLYEACWVELEVQGLWGVVAIVHLGHLNS